MAPRAARADTTVDFDVRRRRLTNLISGCPSQVRGASGARLTISVSLTFLLVLPACGSLEQDNDDANWAGRLEQLEQRDRSEPEPWHGPDIPEAPVPVATWEDGRYDLSVFEDPYVGLAVATRRAGPPTTAPA
jgi:hypothetical protein